MKKFRDLRNESMVPQWLHKAVMAPKMKKLVRGYLNWRKKNPGQGSKGVYQAIKLMGLAPKDGNQLIDTLNDLVKQGKLPKHLAIAEEAKYDYGTPESVKYMKKVTPGQNEQMLPTTAQKRMNRALKKHGVGKNDEFYKSKMDPETRKKYEPKKVERKPVSVEPPKHKPFQWIRTK